MLGKKRRKQNKLLLFIGLCAILVFSSAILITALDIGQAPLAQQPPSSAPISSSSQSHSSSQSPSSSDEPSNLPIEPIPLTDEELFTDALFIGNSCIEGLFVQGYAMQADFFSGVGMTVHSAFTDPPARHTQSVVELLAGEKQYARIFLLFGINEVGTDPVLFIEKYGQLIDHIRATQPNAQIYIQSILPVSRAAHERNLYLVNNDNVRLFNGLIYDLTVQKQVHFLNIYEALVDAEGFLPDGASNDGIHLSKDYNQIWINYLKERVK